MCRSVRAGKCILLLCASIALVMSIVVSYMGNLNEGQIGREIGLYEYNNMSGVVTWSRRGVFTNSTFTPVGWAFTAWIAIYFYQLIVLAHCWTTLCRRAPGSGFLCSDPDLAPAGLIFWHFIASLINMAWIFLADRVDQYNYLLVPQTCVLFSLAISLIAALSSSYYWLYVGRSKLALRQSAYWLTVVFVQNGVGLYAGWATFASFLTPGAQVSRTEALLATDAAPIDPIADEFPNDWIDFAVIRAGENLTKAVQSALDDESIVGQDFRSEIVERIRQNYAKLERGVTADWFVSTRGLMKPLHLR